MNDYSMDVISKKIYELELIKAEHENLKRFIKYSSTKCPRGNITINIKRKHLAYGLDWDEILEESEIRCVN